MALSTIRWTQDVNDYPFNGFLPLWAVGACVSGAGILPAGRKNLIYDLISISYKKYNFTALASFRFFSC